ncbi:ArsR/SmtB family transcription factor [Micromonospora sp. NPDC051925]|uniref:ArsR/SmtB family transcription factor n=1 Tax=Micromonospora sp. NPDC051925 TaxID=3364288 RepID=UPI0037C725B6
MISYATTPTDVSRLRFAFAPLGEAVASLRMMRSDVRRRAHLPWLRQVGPKVRHADLRPLRALVPPTGYVPDFLTPGDSLGYGDLDTDLEAVRETPPERLVAEVTWMMSDPGVPPGWHRATGPVHRWMVEHPERALQVVADQLATYCGLALRPYWKRMHASMRADVHHRMRVMEKSGADAVLSSLSRHIVWRNEHLTVRSNYDFEARLDGRGMVLVPSIFCGPEVLTMLPPDQSMVVYPQPDASRLWAASEGADANPLAALIGSVRAEILETLHQPRSTSDLAAEIGVTPGAVSQHLTVLRRAGLVNNRRAGRRVLYTRTPSGESLVHGARYGGDAVLV